MTTGLNGLGGTQGTQNAGLQQLTGNFDTFLQLLTTQLQNQDPLNPMDSSQFTQQLVQFSMVEQQINTNANLQNLLGLTGANAGAGSVNYLGKTVTIGNGNAALIDGQTSWNYSLASQAATLPSGRVFFSTNLVIRARISPRALSRAATFMSYNTTRRPAARPICAMPAPIAPAPTTPSTDNSMFNAP